MSHRESFYIQNNILAQIHKYTLLGSKSYRSESLFISLLNGASEFASGVDGVACQQSWPQPHGTLLRSEWPTQRSYVVILADLRQILVEEWNALLQLRNAYLTVEHLTVDLFHFT